MTIRENKILTNSQQIALNQMKSGRNVHLSGEGGSGKSFVVDYFIENLSQKQREHLMITAPTGIAAINIGGSTLHKAFGLGIGVYGPDKEPPVKVSPTLLNTDIIIIDEISMVRFDTFTYIAKCIKKAEFERKKAIQLIVVGDFYQLPPVMTDNDKKALIELWDNESIDSYSCLAFQSPMWESFEFCNCHLDEVMRQKNDIDFVTKLNQLRRGENKEELAKWFNAHLKAKKFDDAPTMYARNKDADNENKICIEKGKGKQQLKTYKGIIEGDFKATDMPTAEHLKIFKGMSVMILVNGEGYQNGTFGTVTSLNNEFVTISTDKGSFEIAPHKWNSIRYVVTTEGGEKFLKQEVVGSFEQLPVKAAYGFSIHKSQGKTFEKINVNPEVFTFGQLYVAISRATSSKGIHLTHKIKPEAIMTNPNVIDFYDKGILNTIYPSNIENVTKSKKSGRRSGAGRKPKYKEKTKVMRVPLGLVEEVEELIKKYNLGEVNENKSL